MKLPIVYSLMALFLFSSCKEDTKVREMEILKAKKEKELVFNAIDKAWNFPARNLTPESQIIATSWNEWRLFNNELQQKPASTINAYKVKTKSLVQKADVLEGSIPTRLNKPKFKSRLAALITKLKALNMFLNIDRIPEKRVIAMVTDLNLEVNAINDQIEEIVRRSHIPLEDGEAIMIKNIGGKTDETSPVPETELPTQGVKSFEEIK
ncbi:hypothetical protein EQG63_04315 [Flavobacterium amnicola]|uniref:Lipoprotein n=1 Tax=Flavobacterium amnicola TaxID=2506422 RepID=A0A4Q1K994_9FLAO|nr:hypothetical protein [Flavobacterium amnicola]RXR21169.1 hypothetical protein EQG63_04315 [Flavobacterium amnicola]